MGKGTGERPDDCVCAASLFGHICWQGRHHLGARRPLVAQPPRDLGSVRASWRKLAHTIVDSSSRLGYDRAWLGHGAGSRASLAIGIIAWCVFTFDARFGLPRHGVVGDESGPHRGCRRARLGRGHPGRWGTTAAGGGALSRSCAAGGGMKRVELRLIGVHRSRRDVRGVACAPVGLGSVRGEASSRPPDTWMG